MVFATPTPGIAFQDEYDTNILPDNLTVLYFVLETSLPCMAGGRMQPWIPKDWTWTFAIWELQEGPRSQQDLVSHTVLPGWGQMLLEARESSLHPHLLLPGLCVSPAAVRDPIYF